MSRLEDNVMESQGTPRKARSFKESQGRFARDPEAAKQCAILGGKKVQQMYQKRRTLREAARALLNASLSSVTTEDNAVLSAASDMLRAFGVEDPTGSDALMLAQFVKACKGDTEAARYVRDTAGERPSDQVQLITSDKPIDADFVTELSDEQLALLAESRDSSVALPSAEETASPSVSTGSGTRDPMLD